MVAGLFKRLTDVVRAVRPALLLVLHDRNASETVRIGGFELRVFLSYSRRDTVAAGRMVADLEGHGIEVDIDRRDLPYGEEWQTELASFIHRSDTIVWLVSAASATSQWCKWELGEAQRHNKRLLPVRISPLAPTDLPEALGRIHILPAEGVYDHAEHLTTLVQAIETDRDWMETHTRLGDRAGEWIARGRSSDRLLRGKALRDAEEWRDSKPERAPAPGTDTLDLLLQSRRAATRGLRTLAGVVVVGFVAMAGLAVFAGFQAVEAQRQTVIAEDQTRIAEDQRDLARQREQEATEQRIATQSNEYRALAALGDVAARDGRYIEALKMGLAGWAREPGSPIRRFAAVPETLSRALSTTIAPIINITAGAFAIEPSGRRMAAWTPEGETRYFDLETGIQSVRIPSLRPLAVDMFGETIGHIDPSGRYLVTASDFNVYVRDLETGTLIGEPMVHEAGVQDAIFTADGTRVLSWSYDGAMKSWDTQTGKPLEPTIQGPFALSNAQISPDGARIVAAFSQPYQMRQWDLRTGNEVGARMPLTDTLVGFAFDATGARMLSWDRGGALKLWDAATGQPIGQSFTVDAEITDAYFVSGEAFVLVFSSDRKARLWNVRTHAVDGEFEGPVRQGNCVSGDRQRFMFWANETITVFDGDVKQLHQTPNAVDLTTFAFDAACESLVWGNGDGVVSVIDVDTGATISPAFNAERVPGTNELGTSFELSADGKYMIASGDQFVRVWALAPLAISELARLPQDIASAVLSPDKSRVAAWTSGGTLILVEVDGKTPAVTVELGQSIRAAQYLPDGVTIVVALSGGLRFLDAASAATIGSDIPEGGGLSYAASCEQLLTWSGSSAHTWGVDSRQQTGTYTADGVIDGAVLSPDCKTIAAWAGNVLSVWDAGTEAPKASATIGSLIREASFASNGTRLLVLPAEWVVHVVDATSAATLNTILIGNAVAGATFFDNDTQIMAWYSSAIDTYDAVTGARTGAQISSNDRVFDVDLSDPTRFIATSPSLAIWDRKTRLPILSPQPSGGYLVDSIGGHVVHWAGPRLTVRDLIPATGDVIHTACGLLPNTDLGDIAERYEIVVADPICTPEQLAVVLP